MRIREHKYARKSRCYVEEIEVSNWSKNGGNLNLNLELMKMNEILLGLGLYMLC
jgi:coproporphyrinogen III oxidase-like Fe-S oxidoreductase